MTFDILSWKCIDSMFDVPRGWWHPVRRSNLSLGSVAECSERKWKNKQLCQTIGSNIFSYETQNWYTSTNPLDMRHHKLLVIRKRHAWRKKRMTTTVRTHPDLMRRVLSLIRHESSCNVKVQICFVQSKFKNGKILLPRFLPM